MGQAQVGSSAVEVDFPPRPLRSMRASLQTRLAPRMRCWGGTVLVVGCEPCSVTAAKLPAAMALVSGTRAVFVGPVPGRRQREGLDRCDGGVAGVKPTDADEEFLYLLDGARTHACQSLDPFVDGHLE